MTSEKEFLEYLAKHDAHIEKIYKRLINRLAEVGLSIDDFPEDDLFSFSKYPHLKPRVDAILAEYRADLQQSITSGISYGFALSARKNAALLASSAILPQKWIADHRESAKQSFLKHRLHTKDGLNLSQRVWNYTEQAKAEFEVAMSLKLEDGLAKGISAEELGREVRQYLNNPDMMYRRYHLKKVTSSGKEVDVVEWRRRVVDAEGNVRFVKEDLAHTGQGVYRSARKNALRLTATEINMAYRYADWARWKDDPTIRGVHIGLSHNHPLVDICDELQGDYPKDIRFGGWHPFCRCHAVPITISDEEMRYIENWPERNFLAYNSPNAVKKCPDKFYDWLKSHEDAIQAADARGKLPYWVRDNRELIAREVIDHNSKHRKGFIGEFAGVKYQKQEDGLYHALPTQSQVTLVRDLTQEEALKYAQKYFNAPDMTNSTGATAAQIEEVIAKDFAIKSKHAGTYYDKYLDIDKSIGDDYHKMLAEQDFIKKQELLAQIRTKCAAAAKVQLEKWTAVDGLDFVGCKPNHVLGQDWESMVNGQKVKVVAKHYDLVTFKDQFGLEYSYPLGMTRDNILNTMKLGEAADGLKFYVPKFLYKYTKGFVFIDEENPFDVYFRVAYKNFKRGAMYAGEPISIHMSHTPFEFAANIRHEIGHHIEKKLGLLKGYERAIKRDSKLYGQHYPSEYAKQNATEDFAEAVRLITGNKLEIQYMTAEFEERVKYLRKKIPMLDEWLFEQQLAMAKKDYHVREAVNQLTGKLTREKLQKAAARQKELIDVSPIEATFSRRAAIADTQSLKAYEEKAILDNLHGDKLLRSNKARKAVINHIRNQEELEAANYAWENPDKLRFKEYEQLGARKNMADQKDRANVEKKEKRGIVGYNSYEFTYNSKKWIFGMEVKKNGVEIPYYIKPAT